MPHGPVNGGYEWVNGAYYQEGKYYDKRSDGTYKEYTPDYQNEAGYRYWEGSFHKVDDDKSYDYTGDETTTRDQTKYVEYTPGYYNDDDEGYAYNAEGNYYTKKGETGKAYDYDDDTHTYKEYVPGYYNDDDEGYTYNVAEGHYHKQGEEGTAYEYKYDAETDTYEYAVVPDYQPPSAADFLL